MKNAKIIDFSKIGNNHFRDKEMLQQFKNQLHIVKEYEKNGVDYVILSTLDGFTCKMEKSNVEIIKKSTKTKNKK